MHFTFLKSKKHSPHRVLILVAIFALAITGGVIGGRVSSIGFLEEQEPKSPVIIEDRTKQQTVPQSSADAVFSKVRGSVALLYRVSPRDLSTTNGVKVFTNDAFIGYALALTTDGWLATTAALLDSDAANLLIIDRDHALFRPQKIVADTATPTRFIKVASSLLKPAQLFSDIPPVIGDGFLISEWSAERVSLSIASYPKPAREQDAVESSDELSKRFNAEDVYDKSGLPFATVNGDVIGLTTSSGALPVAYVAQAFRSLLKNGVVKRPNADIGYYDNEHLSFAPAQRRGNPFFAGATIAKAKSSSLLLVGDVLTAVNDDAVSAQRSASELFNEYQPTDVVQLHLKRGNQTLVVPLILH